MKKIVAFICALLFLCSNAALATDYTILKQRTMDLEALLGEGKSAENIVGEAVLIIVENDVLSELSKMGAANQAASLKNAADTALKTKESEATTELLLQLNNSLGVLSGEIEPVVFKDVNSKDWYYNAVVYSVSSGFFKGMSETQFAPDMEITRGMFVTLMERMYKKNSIVYEKSYADVPDDAYYANAVKWAKAEGILTFIEGDYFYPDKPITREELVTVLRGSMAAAGQDVDYMIQMKSFSDSSSIAEWAKDHVAWAAAKKVVTGFEDGSFRPHSTATRAQVAQIFYNQR